MNFAQRVRRSQSRVGNGFYWLSFLQSSHNMFYMLYYNIIITLVRTINFVRAALCVYNNVYVVCLIERKFWTDAVMGVGVVLTGMVYGSETKGVAT